MDKGKQCYKYYSSNVREPLEINTILCSKVGVVWMSSPTNGNLSGLTLGATSLTLGSRDVHVQSFDHVTSSHPKMMSVLSNISLSNCPYWYAILQILKGKAHPRNARVNKASSVKNGLAKTYLVVDMVEINWLWIVYCWLWVALPRFGLFWFVLNCCEFYYSWNINIFFPRLSKFKSWLVK